MSSVSVFQCFNVSVGQCFSVSVLQCFRVSRCRCLSVTVCLFFSVVLLPCFILLVFLVFQCLYWTERGSPPIMGEIQCFSCLVIQSFSISMFSVCIRV